MYRYNTRKNKHSLTSPVLATPSVVPSNSSSNVFELENTDKATATAFAGTNVNVIGYGPNVGSVRSVGRVRCVGIRMVLVIVIMHWLLIPLFPLLLRYLLV